MSISLDWRARAEPLVARACLARGDAARALGARLLAGDDDHLRALTGCASDDVLLVLGEEGDLPWIDGAIFLGRDLAARGLLLPTNRAPGVPVDLLARALAARLPAAGGPWAIAPLPGGGLVSVSSAAAAPIARDRLSTWVRR